MSSSPPDAGPGTLVRRTHLEITDSARIVPARPPSAGVVLERVVRPSPELSRFFYTAVGGDWYWRDRLDWSWDQWMTLLDRPGYETWCLTRDGLPAGYFELDATRPPSVEIVYFGLLAGYPGQGLGGWMLEAALRRGFLLGQRVWLHTATLDSPGALAHYQARGLVPFAVEEDTLELPPEPPGPWPGARRPRRSP